METAKLYCWFFSLLKSLDINDIYTIKYNEMSFDVNGDEPADDLANQIGIYIKGGQVKDIDLTSGLQHNVNKRVQILLRGSLEQESIIKSSTYMDSVKTELLKSFNKELVLTDYFTVAELEEFGLTSGYFNITIINCNILEDVNYLGKDEQSYPMYSLNCIITYT